MIVSKTVPEWLNEKILEWERRTGQRQTWKAFAEWLGVKYTTLSSWRNQGALPDGENLRVLGEKLGYEIYDIVGAKKPDPKLRELRARYDVVPPEDVDEFFSWVDQFLAERGIAVPKTDIPASDPGTSE